MSDESTGEKYERLREEVQNLVLKAYPTFATRRVQLCHSLLGIRSLMAIVETTLLAVGVEEGDIENGWRNYNDKDMRMDVHISMNGSQDEWFAGIPNTTDG